MFKFIKSFLISVFLIFALTGVAKADTDSLILKGIDMPSWVNWEPIYISYTALEIEGNPVEFKAYFKKDGEGWQEVGTSSELTDTFEVSRSYFPGDGLYKIYFKETNSGITTPEEEFNVDFTAPAGVSEYSKERKDANVYKICWKNPNDDDFDRVLVFRSDKTDEGFDKVAEISGSKDEVKCYENGTPDSKDYYYALRAVDHAGNASGVVGDSEINTSGLVLGSSTETPIVEAETVVLPLATTDGQNVQEETKEGEIAGGSADQMEQEPIGVFGEFGKAVGQQVAKFNYWQIAGIVVVIAGIIVLIIYIIKKPKK